MLAGAVLITCLSGHPSPKSSSPSALPSPQPQHLPTDGQSGTNKGHPHFVYTTDKHITSTAFPAQWIPIRLAIQLFRHSDMCPYAQQIGHEKRPLMRMGGLKLGCVSLM